MKDKYNNSIKNLAPSRAARGEPPITTLLLSYPVQTSPIQVFTHRLAWSLKYARSSWVVCPDKKQVKYVPLSYTTDYT